MRIATWNVNGMQARLGFVLRWLEARRPDVVGLQELKLTDERFPHAEIEAAGYHAVTHGQKSWNGVAVLARRPPRSIRSGLPGQQEAGARLVEVETEGLTFLTLYCPNGKSVEHADYPRKLAWLESLVAYLVGQHDPGAPLVVCGDFNVCPSDVDSWNGEALRGTIFHTDEERALVRRLLDWGLVDLYREREPDGRAFSWWDYRGGAFHRGLGLRIDFLLATRPVASRLRGVEIDRDYRKKKEGLTPSDHAPVFADLA